MKLICLMLLALPAVASNAWAHGGGLNKDGCHDDRKNGGYHCHRASAPTPVERRYQLRNPENPRIMPRLDDHAKVAYLPTVLKHGLQLLRRGGPGYGPHLDRNKDGIGCEPHGER